jgi:hypothetical protein
MGDKFLFKTIIYNKSNYFPYLIEVILQKLHTYDDEDIEHPLSSLFYITIRTGHTSVIKRIFEGDKQYIGETCLYNSLKSDILEACLRFRNHELLDFFLHSVKLILKPLDSVLDSFGEWALSKS